MDIDEIHELPDNLIISLRQAEREEMRQRGFGGLQATPENFKKLEQQYLDNLEQ